MAGQALCIMKWCLFIPGLAARLTHHCF